ncbi:(d)CMP kinase [Nanoarchaeota archaeon]
MIITINGDAGSGKSTVAKLIASKLELKHYSNGDFMREIARERGITLLELSKLSETDISVDKELDDRQKNLGKVEDNFIIDSRLGWNFIPQSIKIFLHVDPNVGADRIMGDTNETRDVEKINEKQKLIEDTEIRRKSENKRYKEYYGVDQEDMNNYDLLIDTTGQDIEEVVKGIVDYIEKIK